MGGMRAVAANTEIAGRAEHLATDPSPWPVNHDTGIVAPRRAREDGVRHQPGRGLDVGWVDGRGLDFDQQIVLAA
jgi:hypothetical protein